MKTLLVIIGFLTFGILSAQEPKGIIGYATKQDGNFEIYTINADGSNPQNISNHPKLDYGYCWSKNGETIYFYTNRDGNDEIYSIHSDGTNPINLSENKAADRVPEIAPNGKLLAFQSDRDNQNGEIYLMNLENKITTRLTNNSFYEESPCFSKKTVENYFLQEKLWRRQILLKLVTVIFFYWM